MRQAFRVHFGLPRFATPLVMALALLLAVPPAPAAEPAPAALTAALLTTELGDPRQPGNVKLTVRLPEGMLRRDAAARAADFRVYVYPAQLPREQGMTERHRARGLYLWRVADQIFIDARVVPVQDREGPARVRVVYAPGDRPMAEGEAEGASRYAAELADVILAVDVSLSMNYNDPRKHRVAAARSFIEMARKGGGIGRVGLLTFNHFASRQTSLLPLDQGEKLLAALDKVGAEGLTSLDAPLELAMRDLRGSRRPVVILLTDGKNEGSEYLQTHLQAAKAGVRVFTVGLSRQADHKLLKEMADATGGGYYRAGKDSDLPEIYARLAAEIGKRQMIQATILQTAEGEISLPIDPTVKRLVAMADGGARVGLDGPGGPLLATGVMSSVHVGMPNPGKWTFNWDKARPGVSALALFGDTQFFLDVFPPQLYGDTLRVAATLGQGAQPLPGVEVWIEPLPGVIPERLRLYDDGQHGDGEAGNGVYASVVRLTQPPARFDVVFRAAGKAWGRDDFVRQAAAVALRMDEPPPAGRASLEGDVDFGVLFPGETGTALAKIDLDAEGPRELDLDLIWSEGGDGWPDLASTVTSPQGKQHFELEMTVPVDARPGVYHGRFRVSGDGLGDETEARVRVGAVRFKTPEAIDLGTVPPGTFATQSVAVLYAADKAAPLAVQAVGQNGLSATPDLESLPAGTGTLVVTVVAPAPIGTGEGEYSGKIVLQAGPGHAEIPLRWRVRPYVAAPAKVEPLPGLPEPPQLPTGSSPLRTTDEFDPDLWRVGDDAGSRPGDAESPWEKISESLRNRPVPSMSGSPSGVDASGFVFPEAPASVKSRGDSFWSAWWVYLLAALLLLILLLLLIAYILYRLGKSRLARMLLFSAIANAIMLIIFILLLSAVAATAPRVVQTIAVNLVQEEQPAVATLSEAEQNMLNTPSSSSLADSGSAGGDSPSIGEIAADAAAAAMASAMGESQLEKRAELPEGIDEGQVLAAASQPAAMPLDRNENRPLRRRERMPQRSAGEPSPQSELPELREMAEPPLEDKREQGETMPEIGEARLDMAATERDSRPNWSRGDRPIQATAWEEGVVLTETAGMEAVSHDVAVAQSNPRGKRRSHRDAIAAYPEPRVDISDPERDANEASTAAVQNDEGEPGVEEMRVTMRAVGAAPSGSKPGTIHPPGASAPGEILLDAAANPSSGRELADMPSSRGELRSERGGGAAKRRAQLSEPQGGMPGSSRANGDGASVAASTGKGTGEDVGEMRFDGEPGDRQAGGTGLPDSAGSSRGPASLASGGDAAPSPLQPGGGGDRAEYVPGKGTGGKSGGDSRDSRRRGGRGDGDSPHGLDGVPGGGGGGGNRDGRANGNGNGPGRRGSGGGTGLGEGRFDDMAQGTGGSGAGGRRGMGVPGLGSSKIIGGDGADGLGVQPFETSEAGWTRNDRRDRRRAMGAVSSSVDMDSLVIVVGDFASLPDSASEKLFDALARRLGRGLAVEDRLLSPADDNLSDCLLALVAPDRAAAWSDADLRRVAAYLASGGHIWIDAAKRGELDAVLRRLAAVGGGDFGPLDKKHQLAEDGPVDAVTMNGRLSVIATYQDWRKAWRFGDAENGETLRFFTRALNFFLSGNAESGIVLQPEKETDDVYIEPSGVTMPERLAGAVHRGRLWDDFAGDDSSAWRVPSWSDEAALLNVDDGQGGRAMRMDMEGAEKGRVAAYRTLTPPQDFSGTGRVTLDVFYDGQGGASLSMVLTVRGDAGWLDFETPTANLAPGWNRLQFELARNNFRSLSTGGGVVNRLPNTDRVGRAGFFLYRDNPSPAVTLFRDIRLHEE